MPKIPSIDENLVARGIFLDFEQMMNEEKPQIAGVLINNEHKCYVIDPRLEIVVRDRIDSRKTENWCYSNAEDLLCRLLKLAEDEERHIIGYSNAEKNNMNLILGKEELINRIYYNANMASWFRKRRRITYKRLIKEIKNDNTRWKKTVGLKDLLELEYVGYNYPKELKRYSPAKALREMMKSLKESENYNLIQKSVKRRFTQIYKYNMHDCFGMKHILMYRLSRENN